MGCLIGIEQNHEEVNSISCLQTSFQNSMYYRSHKNSEERSTTQPDNCLTSLPHRTNPYHKNAHKFETLPISESMHLKILEYQEVVKQILKQAKKLGICTQTYYLAICYFETFLSSDCRSYFSKIIQKNINSFRIMASVMLLLSSKLNDIFPPSIDRFTHPFGRMYRQNLIEAEKYVLEKIDFIYIDQSPYVIFHQLFEQQPKNMLRCCQIFERCILEDWAMLYGWEIVAKAVGYAVKPFKLNEEDIPTRMRVRQLSGRIKELVKI